MATSIHTHSTHIAHAVSPISAAAVSALRLVGSAESSGDGYPDWNECPAFNADRLHVQGFDGARWVNVQTFDGIVDNETLGRIALLSVRMGLPLTIDPSLMEA